MLKILYNNRTFSIIYLLFLIVSIVILFKYNKQEIHLFLNSYHNSFFDVFFKYITHLGDGLFAILIVILFLFFSFKKAFITALSTSISGLITQLLKTYVFLGYERPAKVFQNLNIELHFVSGVDLNHIKSFPSGHTTSAFALFVCFTLFTKNKYLKALFAILAIIIGYSRVYLSQHFLIDIVVGSLIGILTALICFWLLKDKKWNWYNKSLLKR